MKKIAKALFCLVVSAMLVCSINAQNAAKNWLFGQFARINFNGSAPSASIVNVLNTFEGSSAISDSSGNLLFFTDGVRVWDKNAIQMPNGFGLMGDSSSTHSALIVPCSCNKYFIFTTDAAGNNYNNGLRYSVVDMSSNGGLGDVIAASKNTMLIARAAEKIAGISDGSGGFWVVGHSFGDNRFFSFHILGGSDCSLNPLSSVTTKISFVGTSYLGANQGIGQIKISPDGKRLAVAVYNTNGLSSYVELFGFDTATGAVSDLATPTVRDSLTTSFYGIEFSPDSKALYATAGASNNLYRYNITANTLPRTTIAGISGGLTTGALQLAPDGRIYIAKDQSSFLYVITDPNAVNGGSVITFNLFAGSLSRLGLPTIVAGEFSCGQQGCCDQVKQTPFWTPDLSLAWKAFEIFNVKYPASDICSIDVDIRNSNNQQPPNPWNGGGLRVNNLPRAVPAWWKSPYVRIPNGTNGQTVIDGRPNFNAAAVNFNLGLDYSGTYTGKVKFIIRHCDGTICEWLSENWTPTPPSALKLSTNEIYLSDLKGEYLPMVIELREAFAPGEAKWLAIEPLDGDTEVFSVDGGNREFYDDNAEKLSSKPKLVVAASRKQDKAALYEFAQAVNLERFEGGEIRLVLKRQPGNSNKPGLRFIFFDENANIIGYATNEDGK